MVHTNTLPNRSPVLYLTSVRYFDTMPSLMEVEEPVLLEASNPLESLPDISGENSALWGELRGAVGVADQAP